MTRLLYEREDIFSAEILVFWLLRRYSLARFAVRIELQDSQSATRYPFTNTR